MTREQLEGLQRFGQFLANEFREAKAGEWMCPMIGADAAADVVEAIAALSAPAPSAVQELEALKAWILEPYQSNSTHAIVAEIDARLARLQADQEER